MHEEGIGLTTFDTLKNFGLEGPAITTITDHPLGMDIYRASSEIFGLDENSVGLALGWLIAQISSPLTTEQSRAQADRLATLL